MTANLPVVDPAKVKAPVMIVRGEYDGIATDDDLLDFYGKLANQDRQYIVIAGAAHSVGLGYNRAKFWHMALRLSDHARRATGLRRQQAEKTMAKMGTLMSAAAPRLLLARHQRRTRWRPSAVSLDRHGELDARRRDGGRRRHRQAGGLAPSR